MTDGVRLPAPGARGVILVVSGTRGVGKSTLLLRVRAAALGAGLSVGGMISLARVVEGVKTGIDVMDAASGAVLALADTCAEKAHPASDVHTGSGVRTGHYHFDPAGLAAGLRWAEAGRAADVFIVDELGPLEFEWGQGWAGIIPMITARGYGCALVTVRPELLDLARARMGVDELGDSSAPVLMVEAANREQWAATLGDWMARRAGVTSR